MIPETCTLTVDNTDQSLFAVMRSDGTGKPPFIHGSIRFATGGNNPRMRGSEGKPTATWSIEGISTDQRETAIRWLAENGINVS